MTRGRNEFVNRTFIKRGALLGIALLCTGVALADQDGHVIPQAVRYSDLDLSRPEDAKKLYERIRVAAKVVCENYDRIELAGHRQFLQCRSSAVDAAVRKVGSDQLTAIHLGRTKRPVTG